MYSINVHVKRIFAISIVLINILLKTYYRTIIYILLLSSRSSIEKYYIADHIQLINSLDFYGIQCIHVFLYLILSYFI